MYKYIHIYLTRIDFPNITNHKVVVFHPASEATLTLDSVPMVLSCYLVDPSYSVTFIVSILWPFCFLLQLHIHCLHLLSLRVEFSLIPPYLGHPCFRLPLRLQTQIQYWIIHNILGYKRFVMEDKRLNLLQVWCYHSLCQLWIIPYHLCVEPQLHSLHPAGHPVIEKFQSSTNLGGHHPHLQSG